MAHSTFCRQRGCYKPRQQEQQAVRLRHVGQVKHRVPIVVVVSLNGGWTADPKRDKPGRDLGYTRFDKMAEALGCHGEYVERPEDIRPALDRAQAKVDEGMVALVNVRTDYRARFGGVAFSDYST